MKRTTAVLALLGSSATLVCCVLPALFVLLGLGATFAGLVGAFPQLTILSEYKGWVFLGAGILLATAAYFQWTSKFRSCPVDPKLGEACATTRGWSQGLFLLSLVLYSIGGLFAFILPRFFM